jgi:hypothetical protein
MHVGGLLVALVVAAGGGPRFVSPLVKVRPQETPAAARGEVSLARNECEGLQLYLPPGTPASQVEVEGLRGPRGARLSPTLFRVEWVPVKTPSNSMGAPGLWPDPLLPLTPGTSLTSSAERPALVYVELCAPAAQRPGAYQGAVKVRTGKQEVRLPLRAQVQPFTLPATSSLPNSFGISIYSLARGHQLDAATPEARALLHAYVRTLLEHRVSAHGMGMEAPPVRFEKGRAVLDTRAFDAEVAPFLEGRALPSGARFTTLQLLDSPQAKTDEEKTAYYRALREHLARRGWKVQPFFYAKDEPAPADYPLVQKQAARVRRAGDIPVLVTSALAEGLGGAADILTPPLNCFFPRPGPSTCSAPMSAATLRRRLPGKARVFWYQSCLAHGCDHGPMEDPAVEAVFTGWASYMVDHPAPLNRAMGPLAWRAGVDGELYFDTVYAYNTQDPWQGVWAFGGNGDGTLFYPGTPARLGGRTHAPVVSLRLKHLRDGLEDYEYLHLLASLGDRKGADALAARLARSGYQVTLAPSVWEEVRAEATRRIHARLKGRE